MTIGCTRCGAIQDGDIINVVLAFKFKHQKGCGQGIGPLAVLPRGKKKVKMPDEAIKEPILHEDIKVEESPKNSKPFVEKLKVFGQDKATTTTNTTTTDTTVNDKSKMSKV